jgi:predicted nucleic acid-binding protein
VYLIDTSVWIGFLRGEVGREVLVLRDLLAGDEPVGIAPPILQEILQGAESEDRLRSWERRFSQIWCYVPREPVQSYVEAARLYHVCRRAGVTPRSSNDCLIARIAIEHDVILLHNDRDFEFIASAEPRLKLFSLA